MNIKKSRIIQIINEEVQKLFENDGSDQGITPMPLTGKEIATTRPDPEELEREDTEWGDTDYLKRMMGANYGGGRR